MFGAAGDIDTGSSDDDSDDELDMGIDDDGESYGNDRRRPRAAPSGTHLRTSQLESPTSACLVLLHVQRL